MVKKRTVVLYPHLGPKAGTGHIKRLLPFFYDNRFNVYIIHRNPDYIRGIAIKFSIDSNRVFSLSDIKLIPDSIDEIILDNRESDRYLYDKLKNIAPIIAIDEGGDARDYIPYCIDTLPNLIETSANYYNPGLLDLPIKEFKERSLSKILITFGGQDPYLLTDKAIDAFKNKYDITIVVGPLFSKKEYKVKTINAPDNLKNILSDYDLIITSFGITAFEAVASKVPVALLNPTDYHQELSDKAGFYSIDSKMLLNYKKAKKVLDKIDIGQNESLTDFIFNLKVSSSGCPICNRKSNPVISRFKEKTYFRCNHCTIDYMASHQDDLIYSKDYFFNDYKEQYGKTYLEDFDHIYSAGQKRLEPILKKIKKDSSLLDIGCAYGPFMKASFDADLETYGIDVSEDAVAYIKSELNLNAMHSSFPISEALDFPTPFNAITMWYVIEHFKKLDLVLTQVNSLLDKGGVFAFSTPNGSGITSRKLYKNFLEKSPSDHYSIWTPKSASKVLKEYGFKIYKLKVTGHHPERFGRFVKGKILYKIFMCISRAFKLGDTFEVYCIKENNL